ncbi:hypothetical protein D9M69_623280 [compost metagenome]
MSARITPPLTGVRASGLRITALPVASAGSTARLDSRNGKLNGEITPTTPCGTRRARLVTPSTLGSTRPRDWVSMAAASWQWWTTESISNIALGRMPPVSRMIQVAKACRLASSSSLALRKTFARSP